MPAKPSSYLEVLGKTYFQACRSSAEFRSSRPANRGLLFLAGRQSGAPLRSLGRLSGPFHWPLHLKPARACQSFSHFKSLTSSSASGHRTLFLNDLTQWSPSSFYPTPLHLIIFPPTFQMWRPKFFHPSSFPFSFLRFLYQQFNPKFIFIFTNFYHLSLQKINFLTCAFVSVLTHL